MTPDERYEIIRKLGQGGLGAVYEGRDHQLGRKVAIKRLLTGEAESKDQFDDLLKECHALSALSSPNIVSVFDIGQDEDGPFVVMELLEGETLEALISRAPLTESDFLTVAEQSLEGLLAAHEAHILHRDLKPCNLMVTWLPSGRMQVKLLDFGLAKFTLEPSIQTIAHGNSLFGSIYFMAPEQFEQKPLDGRTDLYSLGCMFYYALTGEYPFNGESVAQVMAAHLQGRYKDLREYRADLNPALCNWVMSLMAHSPDNRPADTHLALQQLQGVQNQTFAPAQPQGVEMITHPIAVKAEAATQPPLVTTTVQVHLPTTGSIPTYQTSLVQPASSSTPAWVWLCVAFAIMLLVGGAIMMSSDPDDQNQPLNHSPSEGKPETDKKLAPPVKEATFPERFNLPPTPEDLFAEKDYNKDGVLQRWEFIKIGPKEDVELRTKGFAEVDSDQSGFVSMSEVRFIYPSR
ncbi:MAG: protein kinase domain-containing protein [Verrucomicrobiaceae bacterium]